MTLTAKSSTLTAQLTADSNDVQVRVREQLSTEDFIEVNFGYGEKDESADSESKVEKTLFWLAAILIVTFAILAAVTARRSREE